MFPQVKKRHRLPFPASPKLRVVQIGAGRRFDGVQLLSHHPVNVLVGPAKDLKQLADTDQVSVDHAIFVLTSFEDSPIDDVFRVFLWQSFGVPIFELLLDGNENVCAAECEGHEGLHLTQGTSASTVSGELVLSAGRGKKLFTGLSGTIVTTECACGALGTRITDLKLHVRQLAATA